MEGHFLSVHMKTLSGGGVLLGPKIIGHTRSLLERSTPGGHSKGLQTPASGGGVRADKKDGWMD